MLDEALLRPGRLEVQVEIGLADEKGRLQILKVGKPCHGDACSTGLHVEGMHGCCMGLHGHEQCTWHLRLEHENRPVLDFREPELSHMTG